MKKCLDQEAVDKTPDKLKKPHPKLAFKGSDWKFQDHDGHWDNHTKEFKQQ